MATSKITLDEGTTTNTATNTISEDAVTKHLPRSVINTSAGVEVALATSTKQDTGNTSIAAVDTTLGAKTDTKTTATDSTAVSGISIWKQISASVQAIAASVAGTLTVASHAVTNAGTFAAQLTASAAGGYTPGKLVSAGSTNATSVVGSACTLGYLTASNVNAAARYLKIYNKATAPTVGSDTPVATFIIPGNTAGAGTNIPLPPQGMALGTGFAFALTTEATDAGTTGVSANEIVVNYGTK